MAIKSEEAKERRRQRNKEYGSENREKRKAYAKEWKARHPDYMKEYGRAHRDELRAKAKDRYEANPEKQREWNRKYREQNAQQLSECRKAYREKNKERLAAYDKKYREKNHEAHLARMKAWRLAHLPHCAERERKRRAKKRGALVDMPQEPTPPNTTRCYICGKRTPRKHLHLDHIVPLAKGGSHTQYNTAWACAACNMSKNAKHPNEFLPQMELTFDLGCNHG